MRKFIAQLIVDQYTSAAPLSGHYLFFRLLEKARSWLMRSNVLVKYRIGQIDLTIPLSHNLFVYKRLLPGYSENLGRLVGFICQHSPDCKLIDIGAKVGDSVAIIRQYSNCPIFCVEGEPQFFSLLTKNGPLLGDVETEQAFVSADGGAIQGGVEEEGGTAKLVKDAAVTQRVSTRTLAEILARHGRFAQFRILKVDTDGSDLAIIEGALDVIGVQKPILFFEYDPATFQPNCNDGPAFFDRLAQGGFEKMVAYDNRGDLLMATKLTATDVLLSLHEYFSGRNSKLYADFIVFPKEEAQLAQRFIESERHHFARQRGYDLGAGPDSFPT